MEPWSQPRSLKRARIPQHSPEGARVHGGLRPGPLPWTPCVHWRLLPHGHEALVGSCATIHSPPQRSITSRRRCGSRSPHMSSRSLGLEHGSGPLWDFHELMLHGPAAGLLGCWSAGRWLCGHWRHRKKGGSATRCGGNPQDGQFQDEGGDLLPSLAKSGKGNSPFLSHRGPVPSPRFRFSRHREAK